MKTAGTQPNHDADVVIARVIKARGVLGEVACDVETDFPGRFGLLRQVMLRKPDGARLSLTLENHWFHKGRVILKFKEYGTRSAVETLVGACLVISESDRAPLGRDQYYEQDLVGMAVVTEAGCEIGRVAKLMRTGGSDLLVVECTDGGEKLVPFVEDICTDVDLTEGTIAIDPPEGLLEL